MSSINSRRILRLSAGWALLFAGVAGLLLPLLPGVPMIVAGLLLLSGEYHWAHEALGRLRGWVSSGHGKAREILESIRRRAFGRVPEPRPPRLGKMTG